jgi:hypothetical protein
MRCADASIPSSETQELDRALARLADVLADIGRRLSHPADGAVDEALTTVANLRYELEQIERELVRLSVRAGRSWAQIGTDLNLIPSVPDAEITSAPRHAPQQRSGNGAGRA